MKKEKEINLNKEIFRGLMIIIVLLIFALVGTNIYWISYNNQFDTVTETTITGSQAVENVNSVNDIVLDID